MTHQTLPCPVCHYDMSGSPSDRCPECGTALDRGRLLASTEITENIERSLRLAIRYSVWAWICVLVLPVAIMLMVAFLSGPMMVWYWTYGRMHFVPAYLFMAASIGKSIECALGFAEWREVIEPGRRFRIQALLIGVGASVGIQSVCIELLFLKH